MGMVLLTIHLNVRHNVSKAKDMHIIAVKTAFTFDCLSGRILRVVAVIKNIRESRPSVRFVMKSTVAKGTALYIRSARVCKGVGREFPACFFW